MPQTPYLVTTPAGPTATHRRSAPYFLQAAPILQPPYPRGKKQQPGILFLTIIFRKNAPDRPRHQCRFHPQKPSLTVSAMCSISAKALYCLRNECRIVDNLLITQIRHAQASSQPAPETTVKLGNIYFWPLKALL